MCAVEICEEKFEDTKGVIRRHKTLYRKPKIKQHEPP